MTTLKFRPVASRSIRIHSFFLDALLNECERRESSPGIYDSRPDRVRLLIGDMSEGYDLRVSYVDEKSDIEGDYKYFFFLRTGHNELSIRNINFGSPAFNNAWIRIELDEDVEAEKIRMVKGILSQYLWTCLTITEGKPEKIKHE